MAFYSRDVYLLVRTLPILEPDESDVCMLHVMLSRALRVAKGRIHLRLFDSSRRFFACSVYWSNLIEKLKENCDDLSSVLISTRWCSELRPWGVYRDTGHWPQHFSSRSSCSGQTSSIGFANSPHLISSTHYPFISSWFRVSFEWSVLATPLAVRFPLWSSHFSLGARWPFNSVDGDSWLAAKVPDFASRQRW